MKSLACQNFVESIDFYLQHDLDDEMNQSFEQHKQQCNSCALTLQESKVLHQTFEIYTRSIPVQCAHDKDALLAKILHETQNHSQGWFVSLQDSFKTFKKRWILVPIPVLAACFIFFSTVAFKSPIIDFAVSSHEQPWPSEVDTAQLNQVKAWFSKHSHQQKTLEIPHFDRLPNTDIKLDMARLSLVMSGPSQWNKAAHLLYTSSPNKKITVLAFHGENTIDADATHTVAKIPIQLTHTNDLTIAHYQRAGISYVVTSNLHDAELLKLIEADLTR